MPLNDIVRQRMQPLTSAFTANRIYLYAAFSTVATVAIIANACRTYSNFYSVTVYLSRSGRSLLVLANFGFLTALVCGRILQRIFFGPLQPREVERLYDQTWMFVTESLLAFTIFRDDFDIPFVIMFGFLLFIKCFHWLMADRVESMDQVPYPGPPALFHIRLHALFAVLWLVDIVMLIFAIDNTMSNGVGGAVLFANEYAILTASALNSMARYALSSIELRRARTRGGANAPAWENKSMYVFYIELVTDFLKLATYMTFFMVVLTFYGLPLNIIRDVYLTARSFITRLRALVRYHNATRDMDRRYPNATEEELVAMSDRTCIICREEMIAATNNQNDPPNNQAPNDAHNANNVQDGPNVTPKKLPCGHIFHFQCLRSWLERQQSCPTCRRTVLETDQPNATPAQAGARGARAPGQQQQNVAPQGQGPPQGQPPINGAAGWLGRLLGIALQPPVIPGQFPNGQIPPQFAPAGAQAPQQMAANAGWPAPGQQPPPPGYGYPYPYMAQPPIPPQQLQPPPIYRGFYGPGNAWYPWADAQLVQGQQAPPQQAQPQDTPAQGPQPAAGPSLPAETPTPTIPRTTQPGPSIPESPPQASSTDSSAAEAIGTGTSDETRSSTPREAAALAALRRLNPSQTNMTNRSSETRTANNPVETSITATTDTRQPTFDTSNSTVAGQSAASRESSGSPSAPTASSTSVTQPPSGSTVPENRSQAPPLIPLFDPLQFSQQMRAMLYPWQQQQPQQLPPAYQAPIPAQRPPPSQIPTNLRPGQSANRANGHDVRHPGRQPPREALSQLPPTLTDEQLTRMDRLTRDAIDERLRVLENVSGTLWRCIQELHRMRSVLPSQPGDVVAQSSEEAQSAEGNAEGNTDPTPQASEETVEIKGKGVDRTAAAESPSGSVTSDPQSATQSDPTQIAHAST